MRLRGTIPASDAAKRSLRDEKERWADEIARFAAEEKARQRRERVPPTPQRLAKGDITNKSERAGIVAPEVQFQAKDRLDNVRKHLDEDEIAVIARYVVNWEHAQKTKAITANYEGAGGGAYGPRHGGLPDKSREAASIADWMRGRMHAGFQNIAEFVVYATRRDRDGNPLTSRDFMGTTFPSMGDKARRDGSYIMAVKSLAWRLQELERELHASLRGETRQGLNHVRQIVRERGAP